MVLCENYIYHKFNIYIYVFGGMAKAAMWAWLTAEFMIIVFVKWSRHS